MGSYVKGTCEEMCPESEVKLRTKERILHFFEIKQGIPFSPVKMFSRSAAGVKSPRKSDLRTPEALQNTIDYLLKDIVLDKRKKFSYVYDFIFDRLRSVRQEIVMQSFDLKTSIKLLEPIVLFLAYSCYRLCEESIDNFDPKICNQHLQECLKKLLCCYDELDLNSKEEMSIKESRNRIFIESLYQVFNIGATEALERSIKLKDDIRNNLNFNLAQKISLEYFRGNYYKSLRLMHDLPHLLCAIAALKVQYIRRQIYLSFSHGYSSKQLVVPLEFLRKILFYTTVEDVANDCKYFNIEITSDNLSVKFFKSNFDEQKPFLKSKHQFFVEEKLKKNYLPEVLLLKKL